MILIVCPLHRVAEVLAQDRPARAISLLAPRQEPPALPKGMPRLALRFHDIAAPREDMTAPDQATMQALLDFAAGWREPGPLLVHCWMGISRSTAAALILACAIDPTRDAGEAARALRAASPTATPNPLMIALADRLLDRGGALVKAAAAIGRGAEAPHGETFRLPVRPHEPGVATPGD